MLKGQHFQKSAPAPHVLNLHPAPGHPTKIKVSEDRGLDQAYRTTDRVQVCQNGICEKYPGM